ncbi:MAG: phosphoribosylamine--glycine ligase [Phycisphaeraceae bacterium]|nr:MAG: phosphoribosylamine--glycine ligase [Phycisphaeraceae bacterium]
MPERLNVLLIGGGGREHALAIALKRSPRLAALYTTHPENPGLAALAAPVDVPVSARELYRLQQFCLKKSIDLVVIGPEDPLADGYADKLASPEAGSPMVFGPTRQAAQIEADKAWSKQLMRSASVPTAESRSFSDHEAARQYIESRAHDDEHLRVILERFAALRDPARRRYAIDAMLRVGRAVADKKPFANADLNVLKDTGTFRTPGADPSPILAEAASLWKLWTLKRQDLPVIKASGLARGKGVILPDSLLHAFDAIDDIMVRKSFGDAGRTVLVEERLEGPEVSVLALVDGRSILVLPPCKDHKRLGNRDTGPNTGGMGATCPTSPLSDEQMAAVEAEILVPTIDALRRDEIVYKGVLYAGLMLTHAGPKVLEFNCRFGDPECQPLMARLTSDPIDLIEAVCTSTLDQAAERVTWDPRHACCVVLASHGYPDTPRKGDVITGLDDADALLKGRGFVAHAGTRRNADGAIVTDGGRVLSVTALGDSPADARALAYKAADRIHFPGLQRRDDIGA